MQIFGVLGAIATIGLGIPQLIEQIKTKKTGKVNYVSFWIFYAGILLWVIYGLFAGADYWQVFVANFVCILIYSATMYYIYYYRDDRTKKMMIKVIIGITILMILSAILFAAFISQQYYALRYGVEFANKKIPTLPEKERAIVATIAPSLTTFAFLPQFFINLKKKNFAGLSPWMPLLYMFNNTCWVIYYFMKPFYDVQLDQATMKNAWIAVAPAIAWQFIAIITYTSQFIAILNYRISVKKANLLQNQTLENNLQNQNKIS